MDETIRIQFKEEYLTKMHPLFRTDGLHLPVNVLYALAHPSATSDLQHLTPDT